jgi:hypothetical protein
VDRTKRSRKYGNVADRSSSTVDAFDCGAAGSTTLSSESIHSRASLHADAHTTVTECQSGPNRARDRQKEVVKEEAPHNRQKRGLSDRMDRSLSPSVDASNS